VCVCGELEESVRVEAQDSAQSRPDAVKALGSLGPTGPAYRG
jgi:hypothetical protein